MSVLSAHAVQIQYAQAPLVTTAFGNWCFDHLNVQWLNGDENVRHSVFDILRKQLVNKSKVEQFLSSCLLSSILEYLKESSSLYLSEACAVLCLTSSKETSRHCLLSRGVLSILNMTHLFESKHANTRLAVYSLLQELTEYPDSVVAVYEADYLMLSFDQLMLEESQTENKTALMHILANLVFNGSQQIHRSSDRFVNLHTLMTDKAVSTEYVSAWLRLITAVASRSDAGKQITLPCLAIVQGILTAHAQTDVRILAFAFLATSTVLKDARLAFFAGERTGLDLLLNVFNGKDEEEEILRYAAQIVTALAEWPPARVTLQPLHTLLDNKRHLGHIFSRTADQLAWTP